MSTTLEDHTHRAWYTLLNPEIAAFIRRHQSADIRNLALKKPPSPDWPYPLVLDQIKARQKALKKFPLAFMAAENLVLPPADLVEQASSQATAFYKAGVVKGQSFIDLTAGAGIDSYALSQTFSTGMCVEQNPEAASLLQHNFKTLGLRHLHVCHDTAENFMGAIRDVVDVIYLDPQRRDAQTRGLFRFEDAAPNVLSMLQALKSKARTIMLKTSPMMDIDHAIRTLGCVRQVHVVEYDGECKELVFLLAAEPAPCAPEHVPITVCLLNDRGHALKTLRFTRDEERRAQCPIALPERYLFDPGPGFHKAGCFRFLAAHFQVKKLHVSTHLYTSDRPCPDFPGRQFEIQSVTRPDSAALGLKKAHLAVRNYPASVAALRKKLKLQEGGEDYVFACALDDGRKVLIRTSKTA